MAEEDRNKLFNEIRNFSQRKLKKVETKVTTGSGEQLTEKRSPKGLQQIKSEGINSVGYVVDTKPDLQVGMIIPGLLISSQDVAQDKSLLDTYEITHILNLAPGVPNSFEDDYNYKKIEIIDLPETDITKYFEECIDFIQEGIQRGNCLVHCNAGVSRSTAICCAYLMKEKKMKYKESLAAVREARAFAKPNEGFAKQLEQYEDKLFGQMAAPDSSEDKFMARKRAEIEAEKAAISGTSSVKNKLAQFGAQLESVYAQRLQSMTPIKLPLKKKTTQPQPQPQPISKNRKKSVSNLGPSVPPPPPPPPPPLSDLSNKGAPPPPPPPPMTLMNNDRGTNKKTTANKVITNENKPISKFNSNLNQSDEPPRRTAKSDWVDETPIKVAAQKKLWESAHSQQPEVNNVQNKKPIKVNVPTQPISQPQPLMTTTPNKVANKGPVRTNKLGTWETCPANNANAKVELNSASPEPKKKITIKKKDANNNFINESGQPKIDSATTDSNSSTPFSSPGTQRKQMYYGRRTSTQPIVPQQQPEPVTSRKPAWGLRDQVDLLDTTPSSTPTRCRSPALVPTPRDSHSPSPQPAGTPASGKKVFGRVPPRRTSLSGSGAIGNTNNNDLPVVSAPNTTISSSNNNFDNNKNNSNIVNQQNKFKSKYEPEIINKTTPTPTPITKTTATTLTTEKPKINDNQNDDSNNIRSGFKKTPLRETKDMSVNRSVEARKKSKGLNRSSTKEILNLIKTKSRADFGRSMETVDEDVEIEHLLDQLEQDGLENIDWEEIGIDEKEVKDIVDKNKDQNEESDDDDDEDESESEEEDSDSDSDSDSDDDDDMEHTVFKPITSTTTTTKPNINNNEMIKPKITSTVTLTMKPQQNKKNNLIVESDDSSEEETESD